MASHGTTPTKDALEHYYGGVYWNVFPEGIRQLNRRASGDPDCSFLDHFEWITDGRTFERALVLNCGNGWLDRELHRRGLVRRSIGVDLSEALLSEAQREAEAAGYSATYVLTDINEFEIDGQLDLVVNYAAGHHIRYIDRVLRRCCEALTEDGLFLSWDYVGPHRNQYPWTIWDAAWQANASLPDTARGPMDYPHLPTLVAEDPSEAVHSELFEETFDRYFEPTYSVDLGGAIAYLVLADNQALMGLEQDEQDALVRGLFEADEHFLREYPEHNLFAFSIGQPRKEVLSERKQLAAWEEAEISRELLVDANGGEYYPRSTLQDMVAAWVDDRVAAEHRLISLRDLQRMYDNLAQRFPNPQLARFGQTRLGRRLRTRLKG